MKAFVDGELWRTRFLLHYGSPQSTWAYLRAWRLVMGKISESWDHGCGRKALEKLKYNTGRDDTVDIFSYATFRTTVETICKESGFPEKSWLSRNWDWICTQHQSRIRSITSPWGTSIKKKITDFRVSHLMLLDLGTCNLYF